MMDMAYLLRYQCNTCLDRHIFRGLVLFYGYSQFCYTSDAETLFFGFVFVGVLDLSLLLKCIWSMLLGGLFCMVS